MVFIVTAVLLVFPAVVFVAVVSTVVFLIILFLTPHHVDQEEKEKKKRSVGWKLHPHLTSDQTPSFPPPRLTSSDQTVSSPQEPKAHCAPKPPTHPQIQSNCCKVTTALRGAHFKALWQQPLGCLCAGDAQCCYSNVWILSRLSAQNSHKWPFQSFSHKNTT